MSLALAAIPPNANPAQPTVVRLGAQSLAGNGAADALLPLAPLQVFAAGLSAGNTISVPTLHWSAVMGLALIVYALGIRQIRRNGLAALRGGAMAWFGVALGSALLITGRGCRMRSP
ncbi:MAG: hypothetical protein IPP88_14860 [Betaproteobacteria bacterium]|nr:hypothetical protein [Betaproteobacteria bacterium]